MKQSAGDAIALSTSRADTEERLGTLADTTMSLPSYSSESTSPATLAMLHVGFLMARTSALLGVSLLAPRPPPRSRLISDMGSRAQDCLRVRES